MRNYEVTFIVDPVLSTDEIKATADSYVEHLKSEGCKIVHIDDMGLRQLAYPIKRRSTGVYYCIEFESETGEFISKLELALQRDERIIRFLTVKLDKYGVKYNEDKRKGLIGKAKPPSKKKDKDDDKGRRRSDKKYKAGTDAKKTDKAVKEKAPVAAEAKQEAKKEEE